MGSTHHTSRIRTSRTRTAPIGTTRTSRRSLALAAVVATIGLAACGGGDDDDAATAGTGAASAPAATVAPADGESTGFGVVSSADAESTQADAATAEAAPGADVTTMQVEGQQIAVEAHASVEADDVKAAVERITTTVVARGGRIAAADIDYARPDEATDAPDEATDSAGSRATLVIAIPPSELTAVRGALEEVGDVLAYDQLAEDVTDQLADLETRITNQRASIERIRELYANAPDVDTIVRIEAELTNRETVLEQMLASQQQLTDRVAMSSLTVDIATTPSALEPVVDDDPGLGDALAAGWSAFAGGLFAIVLALTAAMPFVLTAIGILVIVLWVRSRYVKRPLSPQPRESAELREAESVSASRPE